MEEFIELKDEIEVDDWLISSSEISRRRLIKRTPSYNIYKADWYGEVLVHEPTGGRQDRCGRKRADSAYSSLSSTPEYHTKIEGKSEFEFPLSCPEEGERLSAKLAYELGAGKLGSQVSLVLNGSSFVEDPSACGLHQQNSGWFELNELRLIAHEGFMLFMGASLEEFEEERRKTSLVMQMNHPKTVSLYELLHCSPNNSLFANTGRQHSQLSFEVKLNICQQVTNAMTYLHDKDIVHGRLTSVNIYIELNQRVKISLIDHDENALVSFPGHSQNAQFNLPALTYLSPELVRTIKLTRANNNNTLCDISSSFTANLNNQQHCVEMDLQKLTKRSDVFSFGTLLFELFHQRYPFTLEQAASQMVRLPPTSVSSPTFLPSPYLKQCHWNGNINSSAAELIYQIGAGLISRLNLVGKSSNLVREAPLLAMMDKCWASDVAARPQFKQLKFV